MKQRSPWLRETLAAAARPPVPRLSELLRPGADPAAALDACLRRLKREEAALARFAELSRQRDLQRDPDARIWSALEGAGLVDANTITRRNIASLHERIEQLRRVVRCGARTRAGGHCQCQPLPGRRRCKRHGGASTGPKTIEGRARCAAVAARCARRSLATTANASTAP